MCLLCVVFIWLHFIANKDIHIHGSPKKLATITNDN